MGPVKVITGSQFARATQVCRHSTSVVRLGMGDLLASTLDVPRTHLGIWIVEHKNTLVECLEEKILVEGIADIVLVYPHPPL
jgi:hypothetical protein